MPETENGKTKPIVYIAGPMRGLADFGRSRFYAAESKLLSDGFIVLNPAHLPIGMPDEKYMPICLAMVEASNYVYMLDGWENSIGARIEFNYAICQNKTVIVGEGELDERIHHGNKKTKTSGGAEI